MTLHGLNAALMHSAISRAPYQPNGRKHAGPPWRCRTASTAGPHSEGRPGDGPQQQFGFAVLARQAAPGGTARTCSQGRRTG